RLRAQPREGRPGARDGSRRNALDGIPWRTPVMAAPFGGSRRWILIALGVVVMAGSAVAWAHFAGRESTDDAQVAGHVSPVATRVGGTVASIQVADNQAVKAGDVLVEIDSRDYQLAVAHAEADLAAAAASARAARTGVPI